MLKNYFFLAFKNLKYRGLRSWLTILGIFIGIAAIISLISLGAGLKDAVVGQFSSLDSDKLIIQNVGTSFGPPGSTVVEKLNEHDLDLIKKTNGVSMVISRLIRVAKVEYNKILQFRYVISIPDDKQQIETILDAMNIKVKEGKFLGAGDTGKIVLGSDFLGDDFEKKIRIGTKLKIQEKEFEVIGILEKSSSFQVNSVILMNEEEMKNLLDIGDEVDLIVAQVEDEKKTEEIAQNIERKLRDDRNEKIGEESFSVQTPIKSIKSISLILNIINLIISGIAAISLIVGGVGIANTMYTFVLERTKEIGIMKAIGAKNSEILSIFVIESGLLGLVGGIIGVVMGVIFAYGISAIVGSFLGLEIKVIISWGLVFIAVGFSFLIGIISGVMPAIQASKLKVVDALRK